MFLEKVQGPPSPYWGLYALSDKKLFMIKNLKTYDDIRYSNIICIHLM